VYFEKNLLNIIIIIWKTKKRSYLLLSYCRLYSKFTIAFICFQSRYFIHFEISNKIIEEDRFEGGREIFMFIKRGHGLRKVEKHCSRELVLLPPSGDWLY
jgi:hypothetical protein